MRSGPAWAVERLPRVRGARSPRPRRLAGRVTPIRSLFPGQRVAKLSDYVRIMKGMQSGNAMGALTQAGLDMNGYTQVATQWGQAMQRDPSLVAKFHALMQQR